MASPDGAEKIWRNAFVSQVVRPFDSSLLDEFHFLRNILIAGSVGAGKTNLAKILVQRAVELGDVFILDVKGEYRDVIQWAYHCGYSASSLAVGRLPCLKLNPLEPPLGVNPSVWVANVADIITRGYGLGEPSRRILQDCIHALYREHYLTESIDVPMVWPTLRELEMAVEEFPTKGSRELNTQRALVSRLHLMSAGELGKSLNTMVGFDPSFFTQRIVTVELDWVNSVRDQQVLAELLVSALWEYRKVNDAERERLMTILFEEAHRFIPEARPKWEQGNRTLLERCYAEGRTYGLGLIAIDQQPSLLSRYVTANTGTKFAGRLSTHIDVQLIVDALVLQEEIIPESRFRHLLPGQMYGHLVSAPESHTDLTMGFDVYQIESYEVELDKTCTNQWVEARIWFQEKFKTALMNAFKHIQIKKWNDSPSPQLVEKIQTFILREIEYSL